MKIIYNKIIPFKGYGAINLFGILFVRKGCKMTEFKINHEEIHTAQMKEMLYLPFYLWYMTEYVIARFFHKKQKEGYYDISFEEEAYNNQANLDYLKRRKRYAWFKYIKIRSNG